MINNHNLSRDAAVRVFSGFIQSKQGDRTFDVFFDTARRWEMIKFGVVFSKVVTDSIIVTFGTNNTAAHFTQIGELASVAAGKIFEYGEDFDSTVTTLTGSGAFTASNLPKGDICRLAFLPENATETLDVSWFIMATPKDDNPDARVKGIVI